MEDIAELLKRRTSRTGADSLSASAEQETNASTASADFSRHPEFVWSGTLLILTGSTAPRQQRARTDLYGGRSPADAQNRRGQSRIPALTAA
jgi:hypothetical protein